MDGQLVSSGVVHAEENALNKIPAYAEDWCGLVMFVTHSPCPDCTRRIIDSGSIGKVFYSVPYRITDGIVEMLAAGIEVYRMIDQYAVVQHTVKNGELVSTPVLVNPDK